MATGIVLQASNAEGRAGRSRKRPVFPRMSACSDFTRREIEDTPYLPQGFIAKPQAEKKGAGEGTGRFS